MAVLAQGSKAPKVRVAVAVDALWACACEGLGAVRPMAALTRQEIMRAPNLEGTKIVVNLLVQLPALERVTLRAVAPLCALMHIKVTARALCRERLVGVVEVALFALYALVLIHEGVAALCVVIKGYTRPCVGDVAGVTGLVNLPLMEVLMAVRTACVDGLKVPLLVARLTALKLVLACKLKAGLAVVEEGHRPTLSPRVALTTISACKLPSVHLLAVTKGTLLTGVVLHLGAVGVTAIAGLLLVACLKRKACDAVIKACALPTHRGVALRAGGVFEGVAVWVLAEVTALAVGVHGLKATVGVALHTVYALVTALQRKAALRVVIKLEVFKRGLLVTARTRASAELSLVHVAVTAHTIA